MSVLKNAQKKKKPQFRIQEGKLPFQHKRQAGGVRDFRLLWILRLWQNSDIKGLEAERRKNSAWFLGSTLACTKGRVPATSLLAPEGCENARAGLVSTLAWALVVPGQCPDVFQFKSSILSSTSMLAFSSVKELLLGFFGFASLLILKHSSLLPWKRRNSLLGRFRGHDLARILLRCDRQKICSTERP